MDKIVIYDTETTNSTIWGSIIEVGAVVVDKNLKEIGKLNIRGRMPEGEVPSAKALLVNSTSIDLLTKGNYSHYDFLGAVENFLPKSARFANLGDKLHKGAAVLASTSPDALYRGLVSFWQNPESVIISGHEPSTLLTGNSPSLNGLDHTQRMMALDMLTYLPDDILVKVDRAAMGVSLETRIPFLDHRVVEFAWRLPQSMKLWDDQTKWALRQVLYRYVPQELIDRPKMGFGVPIGAWLRGPLREWAEGLLDESRLKREGFINPAPVRLKWDEHLSGQRNWQHSLWPVLMFQAWLESRNPRQS